MCENLKFKATHWFGRYFDRFLLKGLNVKQLFTTLFNSGLWPFPLRKAKLAPKARATPLTLTAQVSTNIAPAQSLMVLGHQCSDLQTRQRTNKVNAAGLFLRFFLHQECSLL